MGKRNTPFKQIGDGHRELSSVKEGESSNAETQQCKHWDFLKAEKGPHQIVKNHDHIKNGGGGQGGISPYH